MRPSTLYALVVEDDALILMYACDILADAGFRCHEAADGSNAIRLLAQHCDSVTLMFSDVDMPGEMDGFGLARHVDAHWPHIEIVIASGAFTPAAGDMPERATFLSKPFNHQTVHEHLQKMLPDGKKPEPLKQAV